MSIASQLTALQTDITNARTQITTMGGTVTSGGGSSQLSTDIATIPTGGSGDLPIGSTITVTSDEGVTIEIERGTESQTLVVPSSGSVSFTVHQSGIWNLTANKTGETELTDSVVVSADDTTYSKEMFWRLYLYKDGDECTSLTGGWHSIGKGWESAYNKPNAPTITRNSESLTLTQSASASYNSGIGKPINLIDLTSYTTLKIILSNSYRSGSGLIRLGIWDASSFNYVYPGVIGAGIISGELTKQLDISALSGSYYVGVGLYTNSTITITEMYLE